MYEAYTSASIYDLMIIKLSTGHKDFSNSSVWSKKIRKKKEKNNKQTWEKKKQKWKENKAEREKSHKNY